MLSPAPYDELRAGFDWALPDRLNMAAQACDEWAAREPGRLAILEWAPRGTRAVSYGGLRAMADALAHELVARGQGPGDRIGVLRGQDALCAAAHLAVWKIGAISVPLFKLFRRDALESRCRDSGLRLVVTDDEGAAMLAPLGLEALVPEGALGAPFSTAETGPETPAVLIYTSGTTGAPKGALHGHRMLTGHLPGVGMSHDFLGQEGDRLWTPADWAWIGGLFDVAFAGLALGVPVVAARLPKFDPETAARVIAEAGVRNVFFPPTALRMLKAAGTRIPGLRSVASGGEPLGAEMLAWGREAFGLEINEFYGQTECNMCVSACATSFDTPVGAIGRAVPGFEVAALGEDGAPVTGQEGDIAVKRGAAPMFLGYWNRPDATAEKFRGAWMVTGDRGAVEADGTVRFIGRDDDVITSAGYRIGPAEIEDCLLRHEAVATCGVVGKPDPLRTEIVKAYVVLRAGVSASEALAAELRDFVKERLASYSYPREISFIEALPMTVTGKVIRKELKARAAAEARQEA